MTTESSDADRNWKLKLRYGKTHTDFQHFTIIAEGVVVKLSGGYTCRPGNAFFGMKVWASSSEEAADMAQKIGGHVGFKVTKQVLIYKTDPEKPPRQKPYGYDLNFTPFD